MDVSSDPAGLSFQVLFNDINLWHLECTTLALVSSLAGSSPHTQGLINMAKEAGCESCIPNSREKSGHQFFLVSYACNTHMSSQAP